MSPAAGIILLCTYLLLFLSSPTPSLSLNVSIPLLKAHNFTIFSSLLSQTHLDNDLQGITLPMTMFIPVDQAFFHLSQSGYNRYHKFTLNDRYTLVKAHIFPAYYTLTSLQSAKLFMQPTLATLDMGSQTFLLNISGINGSVQIDTGIVRGVITRTVYDHIPIAIYAVSKVLLPPELFGKNYHDAPSPYHAPFSGFDDGPPLSHGSPPPPVSSAVVPLPMFMVMSSCLLLLFVFY